MNFGFAHIPSEHYQKHLDIVKFAEQLAFDFAWIPDQTFYRDPLVLMGLIARETESIQIGLGVTNPYTRQPAIVARAIATLDEIAPKRLHLGVGAGNRKELLLPLGLDGANAAARCREMVVVLKKLLSGSRVSFTGDHFKLLEVQMAFDPNPEIPVYIAGRGELILQAGGEVADGVIIGGLCSQRGIDFAISNIRRGVEAAGRHTDPPNMISWIGVNITDDRKRSLEEIRPLIAHIVGGAPKEVLDAVGIPPGTVKQIKSSYRKQGIQAAADYVTEACVDAFAILGSAAECIQRIKTLEAAGITQLVVLLPSGSTGQHRGHLQQFSEEIFPAFK